MALLRQNPSAEWGGASLGPEPPEWHRQAACAETDPEAFFPEKGGSTREAKAVCNGRPTRDIPPCPVRAECLQYALDRDERFGLWGGLSERERRKLKNSVAA